MKKEFKLSERIVEAREIVPKLLVIKKIDVKEFIKKLKDKVYLKAMNWDETIEFIDKLAGDL